MGRAPGSPFDLRDSFQESRQDFALTCCDRLLHLFIRAAAMLNKALVVLLSFRREAQQERSAGAGFSFRDQSLFKHGLYGAMHYGAVEAKLRGDLVLIEGSSTPQSGENEAARG